MQLSKKILVLLVAVAALAQSGATQQVTTPTDPAAACSPAQQRKATRCSNRYHFWVEQHDYSAPAPRAVLHLTVCSNYAE